MTITAGIDIGTGAIKTVLFRVDGDDVEWLARRNDRIRRRDPLQLAAQSYDSLLAEHAMERAHVDYAATTGEGESIAFST